MTDLLLDADGGEAFLSDPAAFGAVRGLGSEDQQALVRYQRRLRVYRDLVQGALEDPLPDCFPHTHRILDGAEAWEDCVRAFIASRAVQSPYYRDINPTFVAWLADSGWGQDRWPFLLSLAHFEWMELEVLRWPEGETPAALQAEPSSALHPAFDGAFRNLAYGWRVQDCSEEEPLPPAGTTHLVCFRDRDLDFRVLEVDPRSSAFLARCLEGATAGESAGGAGLPEPEALDLLARLHREGAILGFS
jgi:hypothetical protein